MCHFCCFFTVLEFKNKTYSQSEVLNDSIPTMLD
jgi:hypothetical protein